MRTNESTIVQGPLVRLVPYRREHVPRYHAWMQDPELLELTCSEKLTLQEELANQTSWHTDASKCTFIVCSEPPGTPLHDLTRGMCGDVNAFFTPWDPSSDEPAEADMAEAPLLAELEIMVAEAAHRRRGVAKQALRLFMHYVVEHVPRTCAFCAKIGDANLASIALFEQLGFTEHKRMAVFEQVELRVPVTTELRASLRQSFANLGGSMPHAPRAMGHRELPPPTPTALRQVNTTAPERQHALAANGGGGGSPAEEPHSEQLQRWEVEREQRQSAAATLFEAALWEIANDVDGELAPGLDSGLASLRANVTDQLSPEEQAIVHAATAARPERAAATEAQLAGALQHAALGDEAAQAQWENEWDASWEDEWAQPSPR